MSILNKYKKPKMDLFVVKDRYYDFVLSRDNTVGIDVDVNGSLTEQCLSVYIDMSDPLCFEYINTVSKPQYYWDGSIASGVTLFDIGLTGMDNGFLRFDKDTITDFEFYRRLTRSEYIIDDNDYRLILHPVEGNTDAYSYDMCKNDGYITLKGGFLQGFYKLDGFDYQVLPNVIEDSMHLEFVIRPRNYVTAKNTLNSFYPDNEGIFFYMGTRAENKFAKMYGADLTMYPYRSLTGQTTCVPYFRDDYFEYEGIECEPIMTKTGDEGNYFLDDYFVVDEWVNSRTDLYSGETFTLTESAITDSNGISVYGPQLGELTTDNKYLFFNRLQDGFTVKNWEDGDKVSFVYDKRKLNANLFLMMNRTKYGLTVNDIDKIISGEYWYSLVKLKKDCLWTCYHAIDEHTYDPETAETLVDILKDYDERLTSIESVIGSGSTSEYIDNLSELLQWFSGVTDVTPFIELVKKYVEAEDAKDIPYTEIDESSEDYDSFDNIFNGDDEP